MSRYLMRFIGGKYEGGTVALPDQGDVGIGRAQELAICLVEDMVSRHHAKIEIHEDKVILTDLGSTNGTFVNGERISICEIEHDDRILFGTSILRLEDKTRLAAPTSPAAADSPHRAQTQAVHQEAMSGTLADVSLPDLLQLLGGNGRTGTLEVTTPMGQAQLVLQDGLLGAVELEGHDHLTPIKRLARLLEVNDGAFSFKDGATQNGPTPPTMMGRPSDLLMDAARQNDEAARLWPKVGGKQGVCRLHRPLGQALKSLEPQALDVVQLVIECDGHLAAMADHHPGEDGALLQMVERLVGLRILEGAPAP